MDEKLERVWARWCARRVVHLWDAPEVVARWIDTGDERLCDLAELAAKAPAAPPASTKGQRARMATVGTIWANDNEEAKWVSRWAVQAVSTGAVAESQAQQHARAHIETLSVLLPEHGLAALRIDDEALEDRWLTREVWRALGLPDMEVVCDWAGGEP